MIVVTGGAGFIGSALVAALNRGGAEDILIVDDLNTSEKWRNLVGLRYSDYVHKDAFISALAENKFQKIECIFHMGACSATTETDADYLMRNNYGYTKTLAKYSLEKNIRFIYASSAATYGNGDQGFSDSDESTRRLRPINRYGYSKHLFDMQALRHGWTNKITGLKFFNVYGPNEYHKEDMRSVIHKAFGQISQTGKLKLFKSYRPEYPDGGQQRDFVYVKDCVSAMIWLMEKPEVNGIFNMGTGVARTWNDLGNAVFKALKKPVQIEYIEMPENLRNSYQYFTQADMSRFRAAGYQKAFASLEDGVEDYVCNYLLPGRYEEGI